MANFINKEDLTYCGKEAQEIFAKGLYDSKLKTEYGIRLMPNVKGKQKIATGEVGDMFQKYACPFEPKGSAKLSESFIEPVALKVNLEECYDEFWDTFLVEQTSVSLQGGAPQAFNDWFFDNVLQKELKKEYEEIFWNGKVSGATSTHLDLADGVVEKLDKAEGTQKVSGAPITTANALELIGKAVEATNKLDNEIEDYKIFMNYKDYRILWTALGATKIVDNETFANFARVDGKIYAYGFEVVPTALAKNVIIVTHPQNLVLGYDIADSEIEYRLLDMKDRDGSNSFRVIVLTNIAIGVVYPEATVLVK